MVEDENFDEIKYSIKIYKKEVDERARSLLEATGKPLEGIDPTTLIMMYSALIRDTADFIKMRNKVINAQDRYIKELEKIVNRMR